MEKFLELVVFGDFVDSGGLDGIRRVGSLSRVGRLHEDIMQLAWQFGGAFNRILAEVDIPGFCCLNNSPIPHWLIKGSAKQVTLSITSTCVAKAFPRPDAVLPFLALNTGLLSGEHLAIQKGLGKLSRNSPPKLPPSIKIRRAVR